MDADTLTAVGAVVAMVASAGALGTSIYAVRHSSRAAKELELAKWSRESLTGDVRTVLAACERLDYEIATVTPGRDFGDWLTPEYQAALGNLSYAAPKKLSKAAKTLGHYAGRVHLVGNFIAEGLEGDNWLEMKTLHVEILRRSVAQFERSWHETGMS